MRPEAGRPGLTRRVTRMRERRSKRGLTIGQKSIGVAAAAAMVATAAVAAAGASQPERAMTRVSYSSHGTWAWYNDTSLGKTDSLDQYAQAQVSGLSDKNHSAGFFLRYANRRSRVLVAVSGTGWNIEPSGGRIVRGAFPHTSSGLFRVEIQGQTVRILWNGQQVTRQTLQRTYPGHAVVATVWQSSPTVTMTHLEASSLNGQATPPTTSETTSTTTSTTSSNPSTTPSSMSPTTTSTSATTTTTTRSSGSGSGDSTSRPAGSKGWLSGASGDGMANGSFDQWRATPASIAGTWDDTTAAVQQELYSICGGQYSSGRWNRALDLAIGAIFENNGESWSAAASGAYNDRWRKVLTTAKSCWGSRDPGELFIRFGHEMNLSSSKWGVKAGEEGDYARAFTQFSNLRYQVFPGVKLVLSVNDGSSGGMADVRKLFPGKDSQGRPTVDVYGADSYNAWPHCTSQSDCAAKFDATTDSGAPLGIEKHRQLAQQMGVPFSVNEYSNNGDSGGGGGGGESPAYIQAFYDWAKAHSGNINDPQPGQFLYDCLFNLWTQYEFSPSTIQPQTASAYRQLLWGRG